MTAQEILTGATAIATVASAIAATFAALAASRSAKAAKLTAQNAALAERRGMVREIVSNAQNIVDEGERIEALVEQLREHHIALSGITGNTWVGASAKMLFDDKMAALLSHVAHLTERAKGIGNDYSRLWSTSSDDLSSAQAQLTRELTKLRNLHADSRSELSELVATCRFERQQRSLPARSL